MRYLQTSLIDRLWCLGISLVASGATLAVAQFTVAQSAVAQSAQDNFTCNTDGYSAQIRWQAGQPRLTFGVLSQPPNFRNTLVEGSSRRGIVTYTTIQGETKTAVFVYSDGTCAVTITDASGEITVNELGEIVGQTSTQTNNTVVTPRIFDETLVSFQTSRNAVRIFKRSGETLMNVYNKDDDVTWLNGVPVTVEQTAEGTRYVNTRGEMPVEVFINNNGDPLLIIDGETEEGF